MFKLMLGFISGVILLYFSGELINSRKETLNIYVYLQIVIFLLIFLISLAFITLRRAFLKALLLFLFSLLSGFYYAYQVAENIYSSKISSVYDQESIDVTVFLCGLPRYGEYSISADFCILEIMNSDGDSLLGAGLKAKLRWPLDKEFSEGISKLKIISQQPRSSVNFSGASYETSLFYQRVVLMGKVEALENKLSKYALGFPDRIRFEYHQFRLTMSQYIDRLLVGLDHKGIIRALLLGDKSQLSVNDFKILSNTGTQHLIAISGLHVGLVMFCFYCFLPKTKTSFFLVGLIGLVYVFLVGFSPSAQRAWVMCLCALVSFSGYIRQKPWHGFVVAMFLVLLIDPLSTLNLGFWFSFACVAIIFILTQFMQINSANLTSLFLFQSALLIAMMPVASLLGIKHGVENVFANLLAVPWVSLLILPIALLCFMTSFVFHGLTSILLMCLNAFIELLMSYLSSLALLRWPLSIEINYFVLVCFFLTLIGLFILSRFRTFVVISLFSLMLSIMLPSRLYSDDFEFHVFDVGQGLAIAIRSKGHIWLYDLGPAFTKSSSTTKVILPYLRQHQKSNLLEGIILSHGDSDHVGDVLSLYDEFQPVTALSGQPSRIQIKQFKHCISEDIWENSEIKLELIYPFPGIDLTHASANNHSCVVRLRVSGKAFLLMGDLDESTELKLVAKYRDALKSDVLIAAHHGAADSSSYALLKYVQPEYVVFSAGYLNKFGHPSEDVLERLSHFDLKQLNTSDVGAISFKIDPASNQFLVNEARN